MPNQSHTNQRNELSGLRSSRTHRIANFNDQACTMIGSSIESGNLIGTRSTPASAERLPSSDGRSVVSLGLRKFHQSTPPRLSALVSTACSLASAPSGPCTNGPVQKNGLGLGTCEAGV
jgi:hypothetical protein